MTNHTRKWDEHNPPSDAKELQKFRRALWQRGHRDLVIPYAEKRGRRPPRTVAKELMARARNRAKKFGLVFDLNCEEIQKIIEGGVCQVTGLPFILNTAWSPFLPSLDRIRPNEGYVMNNIQIVVWTYNAAKGRNSHDDVMLLARALVTKENERVAV